MRLVQQVRFNQDFTCFLSCGGDGFRLYSIDPLMQLLHVKPDQFGGGTVVKAEILRRSNVIAFVCRECENIVRIWDCSLNKLRREISFHQVVTNMRFHHDRLIVVLPKQIITFTYSPDITKLATYPTRDNQLGLLAINSGITAHTMAFPGVEKAGSVQVANLQHAEPHITVAPVTIRAHEHELACITLNTDGSKLATASKHGTLVRIFDVYSRAKLMELRRGSDTALVYSLNFSADSSFLCAASDKGTVHIFAVVNSSLNKRSTLHKVGGLIAPYAESQWGITNFTIPAEMSCVCTFPTDQRAAVVVICVDGSYHKYIFKPDGGCTREAFDRFLDLGDNMEM